MSLLPGGPLVAITAGALLLLLLKVPSCHSYCGCPLVTFNAGALLLLPRVPSCRYYRGCPLVAITTGALLSLLLRVSSCCFYGGCPPIAFTAGAVASKLVYTVYSESSLLLFGKRIGQRKYFSHPSNFNKKLGNFIAKNLDNKMR